MAFEQTGNSGSTGSVIARYRTLVLAFLPLVFVFSAAVINASWFRTASSTEAAGTKLDSTSFDSVTAAEPESQAGVPESDLEDVFLFSIETETRFPNDLDVANEDIVCFDGENIWLAFDGSDVGLKASKISSFAFAGTRQILMTFSERLRLPGIESQISPTDIVAFHVERLGADTAGTFSLHFVGENVGLSTPGEHIDALHVLPDSRIVVSTVSSFSVPGVTGHDEDLIAFTAESQGTDTTGQWELYLDGSDVGWSGQDIDALSIDEAGHIYLSSHDDFNLSIGHITQSDVLCFTPTKLGIESSGTYVPHIVLRGRNMHAELCNVRGFEFPAKPVRRAVLDVQPSLKRQLKPVASLVSRQ